MTLASCLSNLTKQLTEAAGPCSANLTDIIESAWDTAAVEACGNDRLRFFVAKRNVILALMGCEAYSIDESFNQTQGDTVSKETKTTTFRAQQQATGSSNRFAKLHGESIFSETSAADSHAEMDRHETAKETGDGASSYRDDSHGDGFNNQDSLRTSIGTGESLNTRTINLLATEDAYHIECNFEASYNRTSSFMNAVGFTLILNASGAGTATGTVSEWRKFLSRKGDEIRSRDRTETTVGDGFKNLDGSANSTHTWLSQFFTDIESHNLDTDIRVGRNRLDSRRHAEAQASGNGSGLSETKIEGNSSAQGSAQAESKSDGLATVQGTTNGIGYTLANSQRFRNLRLMYDQIQERITLLKKRLRFSSTPLITHFSCEVDEWHYLNHRNVRYSQLLAAGMQCYENTCSEFFPMNAPY